jgi:hypothetical protein
MIPCRDSDEDHEELKTCGHCCNASLNSQDLCRQNAGDAPELCHCMFDGIDRFRSTYYRRAQEGGCHLFNRYLDAAPTTDENSLAVPAPEDLAEARTPDVIASEINAIKTQTMKTVLINSITIGGKLTEAKEMVGHGGWGGWLSEKVNYSQDTAENLMKLFREYGPSQLSLFGSINSDTFRNLGYSQALALCAIPVDEREGFVQGNDVGKMSIRQLQKEIEQYKQAVRDAEAKANNLDWKARNGDYYQKRTTELSNENYKLRNELREATGSEKERVEVMPQSAISYITDNLEAFFEKVANDLPDKKIMKIYVDAYKERPEASGYVVGNIDDLVQELRKIVEWVAELSPDCYDWPSLDWCNLGSEGHGADGE